MRSTKVISILLLAFLVCTVSKNVQAQIIEPEVVNGNTYTCYFISSLDIFLTDIQFSDKGFIQLTSYKGNGFYLTLTDFFVGVYWSLKQQIGTKATGDYIFIMSGNTKDPFITGTCLLIYEYKEIFFSVFFGFRSIEGT
jgi:hypothetical protein